MAVELGSLPEQTMNQIQHVEELGLARLNRRQQKERSKKMTSSSKHKGVREHADDLLGVGTLFD
jgi:hypothetical protein